MKEGREEEKKEKEGEKGKNEEREKERERLIEYQQQTGFRTSIQEVNSG